MGGSPPPQHGKVVPKSPLNRLIRAICRLRAPRSPPAGKSVLSCRGDHRNETAIILQNRSVSKTEGRYCMFHFQVPPCTDSFPASLSTFIPIHFSTDEIKETFAAEIPSQKSVVVSTEASEVQISPSECKSLLLLLPLSRLQSLSPPLSTSGEEETKTRPESR
jgi:hypothetical protein